MVSALVCLILPPRPSVCLQRKCKTEILIFGLRWFKVVLSPGRSGVDAGRSVTGIWRAPRSHPDHSNSSRSWTGRISHHAHHPSHDHIHHEHPDILSNTTDQVMIIIDIKIIIPDIIMTILTANASPLDTSLITFIIL